MEDGAADGSPGLVKIEAPTLEVGGAGVDCSPRAHRALGTRDVMIAEIFGTTAETWGQRDH